jgi:rhodanese-related sulfurtransferase
MPPGCGVPVDQPPRLGGWTNWMGIVMPTGIGRDELPTLTGRGAQLVEVLPAKEYEWARLPGAVSMPLKELYARTAQLDRSRPVIVYCHDWY